MLFFLFVLGISWFTFPWLYLGFPGLIFLACSGGGVPFLGCNWGFLVYLSLVVLGVSWFTFPGCTEVSWCNFSCLFNRWCTFPWLYLGFPGLPFHGCTSGFLVYLSWLYFRFPGLPFYGCTWGFLVYLSMVVLGVSWLYLGFPGVPFLVVLGVSWFTFPWLFLRFPGVNFLGYTWHFLV